MSSTSNFTFVEIWETTLAVFIFLVIGGGILFVGKSDVVKAHTISSELTYVAELKSDDEYKITVNIDENVYVNSEENKLIVIVDDAEIEKNTINDEINVEKNVDTIILS